MVVQNYTVVERPLVREKLNSNQNYTVDQCEGSVRWCVLRVIIAIHRELAVNTHSSARVVQSSPMTISKYMYVVRPLAPIKPLHFIGRFRSHTNRSILELLILLLMHGSITQIPSLELILSNSVNSEERAEFLQFWRQNCTLSLLRVRSCMTQVKEEPPWPVWRESRATTACSCYFCLPKKLIAAAEFPLES